MVIACWLVCFDVVSLYAGLNVRVAALVCCCLCLLGLLVVVGCGWCWTVSDFRFALCLFAWCFTVPVLVRVLLLLTWWLFTAGLIAGGWFGVICGLCFCLWFI